MSYPPGQPKPRRLPPVMSLILISLMLGVPAALLVVLFLVVLPNVH